MQAWDRLIARSCARWQLSLAALADSAKLIRNVVPAKNRRLAGCENIPMR
jgi:hypothetical protein